MTRHSVDRHKPGKDKTGYKEVRVGGLTCTTAVGTAREGRKKFAPHLGGQMTIEG